MWAATVVHWWEYTAPSSATQVQIPAFRGHYVGWVCCWFSSLLWEFFFQILPFSFSSKTNIYKIQFKKESDRWRTLPLYHYYFIFFVLWVLNFLPNFLFYAFSNLHQGNYDEVKIHWFVIHCRSYLEKNVRLLMEGVDELCQDANKFNNHLRNVARQQQQKEAYTQRRVKSI